MTTITIKELHARTGEWVRKAGQAGEITVTDRGHPIAVIQPVQQRMGDGLDTPASAKSENPFKTRKLLPGFAELQERLTGGTDSTDIISEMRDDR